MFYKGYVVKPPLSPFTTYSDKKKICPCQIIDLRFQVDHINPK